MNSRKLFDYSRLKGKIKEKCNTQGNLAKKIGISEVSLSAKLNNKVEFSQFEINKICETLEIAKEDISGYFFYPMS